MLGDREIVGKFRLRRVLVRCILSGFSTIGAFGYSSLIFAEEVAPVSNEQPASSPSVTPFVLEIPPPMEEIQTRGLNTASTCGTYQLRSKADKAILHLNGLGDRLVSTRWQPNDDYVRFILELQRDGSVRIRSKATKQYLYEDAKDKLVSTRQAVNDPRVNVFLEPALNGSVRIKSAVSGQYWHYNGRGDKLISTRWQTKDPFAFFTLERVIGPAAVPSCTTDVADTVLAKEFNRAVFDRQAKLVALLQASDQYLAANPLIRSLSQGASVVNLNTAVRNYLTKYPQGVRKVKVPELQAIGTQIKTFTANSSALTLALTPTNANSAATMANAHSGLKTVQGAIENLAKTQRAVRQWGQAQIRNLAINVNALKGGKQGPVVVVSGTGETSTGQIQTPGVASTATNVALGKPARQSAEAYGGKAQRAVDGNTNGNWAGASVTHTNNQSPWWEVDLGGLYDISSIRIWNRTDCCRQRLTGFQILVGATPITANDTRVFGGGLKSFGGENSKEFKSTANTRGRYVRISLPHQDYLSLAEVEVFGTGANSTGQIQTRGIGDPSPIYTTGSEYIPVSPQGAVTSDQTTILVVTEEQGGLNVASVVGGIQQYQQALQTAQTSRPTGNTTATVGTPTVLLYNGASPTMDLFEFASTTGEFENLKVNSASNVCDAVSSGTSGGYMFDASANEGCVTSEPELTSYNRGAGKPMVCASGLVQSGALCYESCKSGYKLVAGVCWQRCPSGYRDDGAFCAKPGNYLRKRYPWKFGDTAFSLDEARARCRKANPTVGCEKQGQIIYSKCKSDYNKLLLDWCTPKCPSNMGTDIGVSCTKKTYSNSTPWGKPLSACASGLEKEGLLCYTKCKSGYYGSLTQCLPN
jgi:hypothetical protein